MDDAARFQTPPEVINYFRQKRLRPAFSWQDVWGEEHAYNFTVAKAIETELLSTFQSTIDEAIEGGLSLETWKKNLEPKLRRLGWWGPRLISDPLTIDPPRTVDFSSPRRLRTIFYSNMRSARAAGQWHRIQRTKRLLPFLLYVRTSSLEPRQEHLAWEGIILPVDDTFWRTHYPPNDWGCKCSVRQITRREAIALGYNPDAGGPQIVFREFRNRRTGEITNVPEGIGPGWQTNAGLSRGKTLTNRLSDELRETSQEIAQKQLDDIWQSQERNILVNIQNESIPIPAGISPALSQELGTTGLIVSVFNNTVSKKFQSDRSGDGRQRAFEQLPQIIAQGRIVDEQRISQPDARSLYWFDGQKWWLAVVIKTTTGFLRVISFRQARENEVERAFDQYGFREQ